MGHLTSEQRHLLYLQAAERTGIHAPLLTAFYQVQGKPALSDGEVGLGIAPANRIPLDQVSTFPDQVHYAANTIRSLMTHLTVEGWKSTDLWDSPQGCYTEKFLTAIAMGYSPPASDTTAALLEATAMDALLKAYSDAVAIEQHNLPADLSYLDQALLTLVEQLPRCYLNLPHQRQALQELVRLWHKADTHTEALAMLAQNPNEQTLKTQQPAPTKLLTVADKQTLEAVLLRFLPRIADIYAGYPHQREALIRLTQVWRQLDSRVAAIASLQHNPSPELHPAAIDSALVALLQRIPLTYQGKGDQRNALVEGFRLWRQMDSRSAALIDLGVNPELLSSPGSLQPTALTNAAIQLDRALLDFVHRLPAAYEGNDHQRSALLKLAQLWRGITSPEQLHQTLCNDLRQMEHARRDSPDASPKPTPLLPSPRPDRWIPSNLQLFASILPNGSFTWAEATHGGVWLPPNQATIEAIARIAQMAQQARDRLSRPMTIVRWYSPVEINTPLDGIADERHSLGDAIAFYCDGLTGKQLYWFLDPWWSGGLGYYESVPYVCYLDARGDRVRGQW